MNPIDFVIRNSNLCIVIMGLSVIGGWLSFAGMPRFEDPEFLIRQALVVTQYPGASPLEIAEEVTEPLERAINKMQEIKTISSVSTEGNSEISVTVKYAYSGSRSELQQVWNKLRNRVADAARALPTSASTPYIADDFGDLYGMLYFITGDGFSSAELERYAKSLQSDLLQVPGVARVELDGVQEEAIYVEISREASASLGVPVSSIYSTLTKQNSVTSAGAVDVANARLTIDVPGAGDSVAAMNRLLVSTSENGQLVHLADVARVWRGYKEPAQKLYRYKGKPAIGLGISAESNSNVVEIGIAAGQKIEHGLAQRPVGIELHEFYNQGQIVAASVGDFALNVVAALAIVFFTLLAFMGLRSALVIGAVLLLTIAATLVTMNFMSIPIHRISLGALIIALGMMVDNAIVVTEGILTGVRGGADKIAVAKRAVTRAKWPLLGGTLVGIIAFAPIGLAPGDTAEYTGDLFWVILISLMFSWVFALTLTPLICLWIFPTPAASYTDTAAKTNAFMQSYKSALRRALQRRAPVMFAVVTVFVVSVWGFQFVKEGFFPTSTTPQIVIDYWLPQNTSIDVTQRDAQRLETFVATLPGVNAVRTVVGGGGQRYTLVYSPESANPSYAQLIARVDDYRLIDGLMPQITQFAQDNFPNAQTKAWRFILGPGGGAKVEAVFSGPDPVQLRQLADEAKAIMSASGNAMDIKDNWRQKVNVIEPIYAENAGQRAGISREDLAVALSTHFSGKTVGAYREPGKVVPIIARPPKAERASVDDIHQVRVTSSVTGATVPIGQVTDGFRTLWRDGLVRREDNSWLIKAQCDPPPGVLTSKLFAQIRPAIEAIELPDGYTMKWDGEHGKSQESNASLASTLPYGLLAMVLVVFILFGDVRRSAVIWLTVPLSVIGVVAGLLMTGLPLEFMGILGLISLSGLLIKNSIVLVDECDHEINQGKPRLDAVVDAAASRLRPVAMGSLTTILGVIPLFFDVFFQSMSVVLVFGLLFATVLTLVFVPVLYASLFSIRPAETNVEA